MKLSLFIIAFGLGFVLTTTQSGAAQSVADFYKGKTVIIFVAGGVGGSATRRARALSRYITKYLPGSPNTILKAMPGAGGVRAANSVYKLAQRDGTELGLLMSTVAFVQAISKPGVRYDASKFSFLGSIDPSGQVIVVSKITSVRSIADAKRTKVSLGSTGQGSSTWIVPTLANRYFGTKFHIISGYKGLRGTLLAVERNEVEGIAINWHSIKTVKPKWKLNKDIFALAQSTLKRDPELPSAPTLIELAKTKVQRQALKFYGLATALGVSLVAPPAVPPERVKALRAAIDKAFADPTFATYVRSLRLRFLPRSGKVLEDIVAKTLATPPSVIAEMRGLLIAK